MVTTRSAIHCLSKRMLRIVLPVHGKVQESFYASARTGITSVTLSAMLIGLSEERD